MGKVYIDFRSTLGYVTDPADSVGCIADVYPVTRGGFTFGWTSGPQGAVDESTSIPNLAGINYQTNTGTSTFQLDLAALGGPGTYNIGLAMGAALDSEPQQHIKIYDGATLLLQTDNAAGPSAGNFMDAGAGTVSGAAWVAGSRTDLIGAVVAGSNLTFVIGGSGDGFLSCLACLYVERTGGGGGGPPPPVTTADDGSVAALPTTLALPAQKPWNVTVFC